MQCLSSADIHPDPYYEAHTSTAEEDACHRGKGTSGRYGAETSDCDTPHALVNATFKWIAENIKDTIDFVIWTGDSARHDSDEDIPRSAAEVLKSNKWVAEKFQEVFGKEDNPKDLSIPIVATFGNNDILPHNILLSGPNKWLNAYKNIWNKYIPEEQRHGFERGGWYYVEVIPGKLAVFSLNTLYFFDNNAAVDGCSLRSEPGYEHMEWLRIQLQFMRERGMKAILMGHVPPARTNSKRLWDETCWQKYTLWLRQYRDVVVGGLYGHMNIDHFMLQDTKEVNILGEASNTHTDLRIAMDDELSARSANDYLEELREDWSSLPNPNLLDGKSVDESSEKKKKSKKDKKKEEAEKKLGGPWGERFHVTLVSPSVVPNFFPTLRVIEYNITGFDKSATWANPNSWSKPDLPMDWLEEHYESVEEAHGDNEDKFEAILDDGLDVGEDDEVDVEEEDEPISRAVLEDIFEDSVTTSKDEKKVKKVKNKKKKKKKLINPDLIVPDPPTKGTPPGPAYSPQSLTLLGYTQYFANLTYINNEKFVKPDDEDDSADNVDAEKWHEGKHKGKHPKDGVPDPKSFQFEVEYDTFTDPIYKLKDLTVKSYIQLAHRIGQYKPQKGDQIEERLVEEDDIEDLNSPGDDDNHVTMGHKKKKHHKQNEKNKVWLNFIKRAFVGTLEEEELREFENIHAAILDESLQSDFHDREL